MTVSTGNDKIRYHARGKGRQLILDLASGHVTYRAAAAKEDTG